MNRTPYSLHRRSRVWTGACLGLALFLGVIGGPSARAEEDAAKEPPARPPLWVIAVSPFLEMSAKEASFQALVRFLVTQTPTDTVLTVLDGYRLRTVARMEIPRRDAFRSEKTRLNQFSEALRETKRFFATNEVKPAAGRLDFTGALKVPALLDFVADHLVPAEREVRVILLGSPLHLDEKEPSFSMADGYFPSDSHLGVPRDRSVYGTRDRQQRLDRVRVDWGYFGDPWVTELHREKVERFWRMFVRQQGGSLRAIAADLPVVFASTLQLDATPSSAPDPEPELASTDGKLEMIRVTRATESMDWIRGEQVVNAAKGPPTRLKGPVKIGIRWRADVDLDLYARPGSGRERLSFEHTRSPEGYHFKDHRTSPGNEFEFIEFRDPVSLRELEVWVNLYEGHLDDHDAGEVRLEFDGGVYSARFEMRARNGNEGREGRGQERWWTRIDVPRLVGLGSP